MLMKMFFVDLLEGTEFIDPRIIDENIQLAECFLRFVKKTADFRRYGYVGLYGDCFPPTAVMSATTVSAPALLAA